MKTATQAMLAAALVIVLASRAMFAAAPATQATTAASTQPVAQDGPIIVDDLLRVSITDLTGPGVVTPVKCRVNEQLQISMPLIPLINVKRMTLDQAAKAIIKAYRDANFIPNANVTVQRIESGLNPSMRSGPIRAGDFVQIEIVDLVGPGVVSTFKSQLTREGTFTMPLVGAVPLIDLTEAQAEKAVQQAYRKANLIPNAMVAARRISAEDAKAK